MLSKGTEWNENFCREWTETHWRCLLILPAETVTTLHKINTKMGALLRIHSLIDPTVLYWVPVTCLQQTVKPNIECGTKSLGYRNLTAILLSTLLSVPKLLVPWFSHLQNGANSVLLSIAFIMARTKCVTITQVTTCDLLRNENGLLQTPVEPFLLHNTACAATLWSVTEMKLLEAASFLTQLCFWRVTYSKLYYSKVWIYI